MSNLITTFRDDGSKLIIYKSRREQTIVTFGQIKDCNQKCSLQNSNNKNNKFMNSKMTSIPKTSPNLNSCFYKYSICTRRLIYNDFGWNYLATENFLQLWSAVYRVETYKVLTVSRAIFGISPTIKKGP